MHRRFDAFSVRLMKHAIWIAFALLILLRNDFWFWPESFLVFGFLPVALVHQIAISFAAVFLWILATKYCWPAGLDDVQPRRPHHETDEGK